MVRRLCTIGLVTLLTGCAAKIQPYSNVTYEAEQGVDLERLAILPVRAGAGVEGFRRLTADSLYSEIKRNYPDVDVIPADSSSQLLNDAGLANTYASMIESYRNTGILDQEKMRKLASVLEVDHMLHAAVEYSANTETSYSFFGGFETTDRQKVAIFARLWSPTKGDIVWEADAGAEVAAGDFQKTRKMEDILAKACDTLANNLPR